jgi:hypothetical protein
MVRTPAGARDALFITRPHRSWIPPNFLYNGYRRSFPGVKRRECGVGHRPTRTEVNESVELYDYFPSGPTWPVTGSTLFFKIFSYLIKVTLNVNLLLPYRHSPWWGRASSVSRLHDHSQTHHPLQNSSGGVIGLTQRLLTTHTRGRHPCPRRDSSPQS